MIEFGDLGVYDDPQAAAANTAVLNAYIAERAGKAIAIQFTGPFHPAQQLQKTVARVNRREPGTVYFDLSAGPITFNLEETGVTDLLLGGGGSLVGLNAASPTTPFFRLNRTVTINPSVSIRDLRITSENGSGILIQNAGTLFNLCNVWITASGAGTMAADDMSDLSTASYGLKIEDSDGTRLEACQIKNCANHGLIADRWHAGATSQVQIHGCAGSGLKGQFINGTALHLRCESNKLWGVHVRNCGSIVQGEQTSGGQSSDGEAGMWELWCENNNTRDAVNPSGGHPFRQTRFEPGCARLNVLGRSGWAANMVDMPNAVRVSNRFASGVWIDPSSAPAQDMKNMIPADIPDFSVDVPSVHNWASKWPDVADRPNVVMVNAGQADQRLDITIPAGAYENGQTGDFWHPMHSSQPVSGDEDDLFLFSAKLSIDSAGASNSTSAEASSPRQTGWLFDLTVDPFTNGGLSGASLWDTHPRQFVGRVFNNTFRSIINLSLRLIISSRQQFAGNPASQMILSIHEFKLYRLQ